MSGISRDHGAYMAKLVAYQAQRREVQENTKAVLFKTLAAASIATVIVTSGGSGDAGQIRDVSVYDGTGADTALPDVDFGILATVTEACSLREVIGSMAHDLPKRVHKGRENGDGVHGRSTFAVVGRGFTRPLPDGTLST